MRAAGIRRGRDHRLDCGEALAHPMMVPGIDFRLLVLELSLDVLQRDEVVERMNVASDYLRDGAHFGALERIGRQQRRLRMDLVEIFDDRQRLDQNLTIGQFERRHPHLWIDRAKFRLALMAAFLGEMDGHDLIGQAFEIERDAHAVGGGRAEIGIELQGCAPALMATATI